VKNDKQLPVAKAGFLAKIRATAPAPSSGSLLDAAVAPRRPRLVFGVDATASRQPAWEQAKAATDGLFTALPGELDVALAVHGGGYLHTFTPFTSGFQAFRDQAAQVTCKAGHTVLCELMERTLDHAGVKVMIYIGDAFEESPEQAFNLADSFKARGIKAVMMFDSHCGTDDAREVFAEIAKRTGGACLDLHMDGPANDVRDVLAAVAVLAAGGTKLLRQRAAQLPGAAKLLAGMD
jgi:hypothetical protein